MRRLGNNFPLYSFTWYLPETGLNRSKTTPFPTIFCGSIINDGQNVKPLYSKCNLTSTPNSQTPLAYN